MKGIYFGEPSLYLTDSGKYYKSKHSFDDWGLLLASADVPPAKPKTTYVDLPGGHGTLDLSEANGGLKYKDRECSFTFYMNLADGITDEAYESKKREILETINGKSLYIVLDECPDRRFEGRCWLDEWASDKRIRKFVIVAKVKPLRFKHKEVIVEVTKEDGVNAEVELVNDGLPVKPVIACTGAFFTDGPFTILRDVGAEEWEEHSVVQVGDVAAAQHDLVLSSGTNSLTITSGSGTIFFVYTERGL